MNVNEADHMDLATKDIDSARLIVKEGVSPETFDLHDAQLLLDTVFATPNPTRQQYRDAVDVLGQRPVLSSILTSVVTDPDLLRETGARSFLHSNGMERVNLLSTDKYQLRLHMWWSGIESEVTEDPHDHVYNFASSVVVGAITTDIFRRSDEGIKMGEYTATTQKASTDPEIGFRGGVLLLPASPPEGIILPTGEPAYTMKNSVIHRVRNNPADTIVTLNLRSAQLKDRAIFFKSETNDRPGPKTSPLDVAGSLTRVLSIIDPNAVNRRGSPDPLKRS